MVGLKLIQIMTDFYMSLGLSEIIHPAAATNNIIQHASYEYQVAEMHLPAVK